MGVLGTVFAALVAILLFNDWKEPAKYQTDKEQVEPVKKLLAKLRFDLSQKFDIFNFIKKVDDSMYRSEAYFNLNMNDFRSEIFEVISNIKHTEVDEIYNIFTNIDTHYTFINIHFKIILQNYKKFYETNSEEDLNNIVKSTSRAVGFYKDIKNLGKTNDNLIKYDDLSEMIESCIKEINKLDEKIIKYLKVG
ncbi:hypothetical protein TOL5_28270 [Acinetobacter sp. Tol 5]|nr:hypothetical protein TOL5_28270 [Acinetobacter sp. Tol 5]